MAGDDERDAPVFGARVAKGVVYPGVEPAFLVAEDVHARDSELDADGRDEVLGCREAIAAGRAWGASGNALAIGLFLLNTVASLVLASWKRSEKGSGAKRQAI